MIAYIISFALSLLFMYWAINKRKKGYAWLLHIFAVLPPVFLLTFRAEVCGTDTVHYVDMFELLDVRDLTVLLAESRLEPLFTFLMYGVKSLNFSVEYLFFICGLLTIVPIYAGSIRLKSEVNPIIPMALFYLMFYHYSFNIVRQSIAMSILFLATIYMLEKKQIISCLLGVIAVMFHSVALVFFLIFIANGLNDKNKKYLVIFVAFSALLVLYINPSFIIDNFDRFQNYQDMGKATMQMSYLVEMIINFLVVLFIWNKGHSDYRKLFIFVSGFGVFLILMSTRGPFIFRIATCIDILLLIYIPLAMKNSWQKYFTISYIFL